MSGAHFLAKGATVCPTHPDARVLTDSALDVCVCTYNPPVATEPKKAQEQEQEEQNVPFKTPEEIVAERERQHVERRRMHVRSFEREISSAIENMVVEKKDTCTAQYNVYTRYPLVAADYAEIRQRLDAKGYTVTFTDKVTNQPLETVVQSAQCTCCSSSGGALQEGESVLREMRRIGSIVTAWWNRVTLPPPRADVWDYQVVEAHLALKKPGQSPSFQAPVQQHQPQTPIHAQAQQQQSQTQVLETLLTCPIWLLFLGFAIVPCLMPRIFFPFWQLFAMFVLVARLVRWTSGTGTGTSSGRRCVPSHGTFVPCSAQQQQSCVLPGTGTTTVG